MSKNNPLFYAMKRSEYAFKRSEFDPSEHTGEKLDWFRLKVGENFDVSSIDHKESSIRAMAHYRSNYSGYEFKVSKTPSGVTVTRVA
jgi:hypothetical protein